MRNWERSLGQKVQKICSELRNFSAKKLLFKKISGGKPPDPQLERGIAPPQTPPLRSSNYPPLFSRLRRHCRWGGNICDVYIENFLANHLVKGFSKSVHICQSYYFFGTRCIINQSICLLKYFNGTLNINISWTDIATTRKPHAGYHFCCHKQLESM